MFCLFPEKSKYISTGSGTLQKQGPNRNVSKFNQVPSLYRCHLLFESLFMICGGAIARGTPFYSRLVVEKFQNRRSEVVHARNFERKPLTVDRRLTAMEPMAVSSSSLILTSGASGRVNALVSLRSLKSVVAYICALVLVVLGMFRGQSKKASSDEKQKEGGRVRKSAVVKVRPGIVRWRSAAAMAVEQEVAVRRGLAIRRVVQDDDGDSVREYFLYVTPRNDTLFTQSWTPASVKIRGVIVVMHGLNEHSGRYSDFAKQLNAIGFKVFGMDWIGHGGSDGLHAFVPSLDDAVFDLKSFLDKVLSENPGLPCFCFGHSTGAAIILKAMVDPKVAARIAGVAITSPAVGVQPSHPIFAVLAPVFSFLLPRYQLSAANKKGTAVSRDPEALAAKYSDPLVYTGSIRIRTGYEILRITEYLQKNLSSLTVPFLVLHGTSDTITDPLASRKLYEEASSTDKSIKLFEGLLHDLLFEPERKEIVKDIIEWLNSRM